MTTKKSLRIIERLRACGHTAYYAGGYVRDLLMGRPSDEIDIATSASPTEVQKLFDKTIPVGISFGVIIVIIDDTPFEVASFRSDGAYVDGRHPTDIHFSSPEVDAKRRDFTINGMFYDPIEERVLDFVGGQEDLKTGIIRAIGDPHKRFDEDRLRMIRAVRFAARFDFAIEAETAKAIEENAHRLLPAVSMERIWQEFGKMRNMGRAFLDMQRFGLLQTIFPALAQTSLSELEKKVEPFSRFPKDTPTILFLREILPDTDNLVLYMKASREDQRLLDYFDTTCHDLYDWTQFYKNGYLKLYLDIEKAKGHDLQEHQMRIEKLKPHIERKKPVVTSMMLKERGIEPGPKMGQLLQKAERLAINENLSSEEILRLLSL